MVQNQKEMESQVMIDIDILDDIEDESLPFYKKMHTLLLAINDWDEDIHFLEDYISGVRLFLGGTLELQRSEIMERISGRFFNDAWKMESITILSEILKTNDENLNDSLNELIDDLTKYLNSSAQLHLQSS